VGDGWWGLWRRLVAILVEEIVVVATVGGRGQPWVDGERREGDV